MEGEVHDERDAEQGRLLGLSSGHVDLAVGGCRRRKDELGCEEDEGPVDGGDDSLDGEGEQEDQPLERMEDRGEDRGEDREKQVDERGLKTLERDAV